MKIKNYRVQCHQTRALYESSDRVSEQAAVFADAAAWQLLSDRHQYRAQFERYSGTSSHSGLLRIE